MNTCPRCHADGMQSAYCFDVHCPLRDNVIINRKIEVDVVTDVDYDSGKNDHDIDNEKPPTRRSFLRMLKGPPGDG